MKCITIDFENVAIMDTNHSVGRIEELISREDFSSTYGVDLTSIVSVAFEPDRGIYHIETSKGVTAYLDYTEHTLLSSINDIFETMLKDEAIKLLEKTKPSKYHTINVETLKHEITPKNQLLLDKDKLVSDFTTAITAFVQSKIEEYNTSNNLYFANIDSVFKYTSQPTYIHYQFCVDVVEWNTLVWEKARTIQKDVLLGNRNMPTVQVVLSEMPVLEI